MSKIVKCTEIERLVDCQMLKKGGNRQLPQAVIWGFFWSDKNILKLDNNGSTHKDKYMTIYINM